MKSPLSPNDIEVLIWCHTRPEPHERLYAPAVREAIEMWLESGMIEPDDMYIKSSIIQPDCVWRTTDKGHAMIKSLCNTPEPISAWLDCNGKTIGIAKKHAVTPASSKTTCAMCGEYKKTPIRNDAMGGYVCPTCIDRELNRIQSENRF